MYEWVNLVSKQLVSQLNFKDIKATMVLCSKFDLWSVCIFLNTEKPRLESAFEHGMHNRPTISWYSFGNLWLPSAVSNFPTSHQNDPARGFVVPSAAWYVLAAGRSCGERVKSKKLFSQSLQRLRISCGKRLARLRIVATGYEEVFSGCSTPRSFKSESPKGNFRSIFLSVAT